MKQAIASDRATVAGLLEKQGHKDIWLILLGESNGDFASYVYFFKRTFRGWHNFKNSGGNTFNLALYTSSASLGASTTAYTTSNEASGTNYTAKGASLTRVDPTTSGTTAFTDFADLTFSNATVTANGCLIFNDSASGDPAVCVLAFGGDKTSTAGDLQYNFQQADASNAIIRIA